MSGLDWPGLMRAGIGGLKLRPAEFWALTPIELRLLLGIETQGSRADGPMSRARLEELAMRFPDRARPKEGNDAVQQ